MTPFFIYISDANRACLMRTGATRVVRETLKGAVPPGSLAPGTGGTPGSRQLLPWSWERLLQEQCSSRQAGGIRFPPGRSARRYGHLTRQACIKATAERTDKANAVRRVNKRRRHTCGGSKKVCRQTEKAVITSNVRAGKYSPKNGQVEAK